MGGTDEELGAIAVSTSVDRSELARPRFPNMDRWIPIGFWSGSWANTVTTNLNTFTANTLYAWPFPSNGGGLIYQMAAQYFQAGGQGAGNFRFGLYAATSVGDLYPNRLVFDSDSFSLQGGSGQKVNTLNKSVTAQRVYWAVFCYTGVGAAGTSLVTTANPDTVLGYGDTVSGQVAARGLSVAFTYAALPTTFPTGAAFSGAAPLTTPPVYLKFKT